MSAADAPASPSAPSFELLLAAMNEPSGERVAAAFAEAAQLHRHGPADEEAVRAGTSGPPAETFTGREEIERWLRRTPSQYSFGLAATDAAHAAEARAPQPQLVSAASRSEASDEDKAGEAGEQAWRIEYTIRGPDFANRGLWLARFDGDGRLLWLGHRPFALRE